VLGNIFIATNWIQKKINPSVPSTDLSSLICCWPWCPVRTSHSSYPASLSALYSCECMWRYYKCKTPPSL